MLLLWLVPSNYVPKVLWTIIFICTIFVVFLESVRKTRFLRPMYRSATMEQIVGFWGRSFFIWVLPFFQAGYSKELQLEDIPRIDPDLEAISSRTELQVS
jgi:hypothetical protein